MTKEQFDLLDKNSYIKYNIDDLVIEDCVDAQTLLCSERFDFYGILIYIDHKVSGVQNLDYAKNIYFERTRSMTGFRFRENGNECKNTFDSFLEVLDRLIDDFQNNKYEIDRTYVPVDNNYVPLDGAHRICCAAYFHKKIKILRFPNKEYQFKGYQYLKKELLPPSIADAMALEAMKWHKDLFVFFLWPQAYLDSQKLQRAINMIEESTNVLYDTEYNLTYHAVQNLLLQIYGFSGKVSFTLIPEIDNHRDDSIDLKMKVSKTENQHHITT